MDLQTSEEVVARKIGYRAAAFKTRDVFDLAASPATTLRATLLAEASDRFPILLTVIRRHDAASFARANIRPLRGFRISPTPPSRGSRDHVEGLLRS